MKTVDVASIIRNAASRAGLDGSSEANLPTTTKTIMLDNLAMHVRDSWEFFDWPELCRTEQRTTQTGVDGDIYLDIEQVGQTPMGAVFGVFRDNPASHAAPRELVYTIDADKVRLPSDTPASVWVRFRLQPIELSTVPATALEQTLPQILADYCKFSLTGDVLTEDGQIDKSAVMYNRAELSLIKEIDKITLQQNQTRRWTASVSQY
jgi:hypothetical protein